MERVWRGGFVCFLAYAARLELFVMLFYSRRAGLTGLAG
jgi:hypothetical protein